MYCNFFCQKRKFTIYNSEIVNYNKILNHDNIAIDSRSGFYSVKVSYYAVFVCLQIVDVLLFTFEKNGLHGVTSPNSITMMYLFELFTWNRISTF